MCIAILTTAHPDYPFILLNNRDVGSQSTLGATSDKSRSTFTAQQLKQPGGHHQTLKS